MVRRSARNKPRCSSSSNNNKSISKCLLLLCTSNLSLMLLGEGKPRSSFPQKLFSVARLSSGRISWRERLERAHVCCYSSSDHFCCCLWWMAGWSELRKDTVRQCSIGALEVLTAICRRRTIAVQIFKFY